MKILATSDLHGFLPVITEKADVLVIAGDVTPVHDHNLSYQQDWLDATFRKWLEAVREKVDHVVGIAGNHDFIFEHPDRLPDLPWTYLEDDSTLIDDVKFYGLPWCPDLVRWAFYADPKILRVVNEAIPSDTDVLLSHSPPRGYTDLLAPKFSHYPGHRVGSVELQRCLITDLGPKYLITGHIHEGFGAVMHENEVTDIYNVSLMDEHYVPHDRIVSLNI